MHRLRPRPDDFEQHAHDETMEQLRRRYQSSNDVIARWCREIGRTPMKGGTRPIKMPDGFVDAARGRPHRALAALYGVSRRKVSEWIEDAGIAPPARPGASPQRAKAESRRVIRPMAPPGPPPAKAIVFRDHTVPGRAADFLRRLGPVSRCREDGIADVAGRCWRRGSTILTDAELIERAQGRGWVA